MVFRVWFSGNIYRRFRHYLILFVLTFIFGLSILKRNAKSFDGFFKLFEGFNKKFDKAFQNMNTKSPKNYQCRNCGAAQQNPTFRRAVT